MKPAFQWPDPIEIEVGRKSVHRFKLYKPNGKAAAIDGAAIIRFKLSAKPGDTTPLLDIDSLGSLPGGSIVIKEANGTDETVPAQVRVAFCQNDTIALEPGEYFGEIGLVDTADGNAFKRAGFGSVLVRASPGGDVGTS